MRLEHSGDRLELISGSGSLNGGTIIGQLNDDNELFHRQPLQAVPPEQEAYLDWLASSSGGASSSSSSGTGARPVESGQSASTNRMPPQMGNQWTPRDNDKDDESPALVADFPNEAEQNKTSTVSDSPLGLSAEMDKQQKGPVLEEGRPKGNKVAEFPPNMIRMEMVQQEFSWPGGFFAQWRLNRLVQRIAPDLNCYTGSGQQYRGNVSTSLGLQACLSWSQVSQMVRSNANKTSLLQTQPTTRQPGPLKGLDHNYCRNPNGDSRGPWCFVLKTNGRAPERRTVSIVRSACNIPACSEYLWIYIVAPPLALLVLLSSLVTLVVLVIRKAQYNSIFAHHEHKNTKKSGSFDSSNGNPSSSSNMRAQLEEKLGTNHSGGKQIGLARLLQRNANRLFAFGANPKGRFGKRRRPKRNNCGAGKSLGSYLGQDDMFEIVDDIDWSDGSTIGGSGSSGASNQLLVHSHSMSPKSGESMRLNQSSSIVGCKQKAQPFSRNAHQKPSLPHCKSINPIFIDKKLNSPTTSSCSMENHQEATSFLRKPTAASISNGPIFATLRCHVRDTLLGERSSERKNQTDDGSQTSKPLSILDQCDLAVNNLTKPSLDKLISYSSSSNSCNQSTEGQQGIDSKDGCQTILANELPQLDGDSVSILYDRQPIFEGKFSQVQMAHINQGEDPGSMSTIIGAQVAVCALKQEAAIERRVFEARSLLVENLNHLNLLKLIGYIEHEDGQISNDKPTFALVFDMSHLIDLNDWLRDQSKDSFADDQLSKSSSNLRQNLTCFAKQIALALDYLHDREIIYKDLACRNCFLDVTKMLVKLASFNHELVLNDTPGPQWKENTGSPSEHRGLKSMIRPKYLLDYYVIDSRPSECQLLPLSWIPLESILFNKFNKQTDIWSFGCLLYELFSLGEVAYFGYSSKQVIDAVRSNLMPPQPLLCPNGIYKLMCKCLSDIPTLRPNVKQIYEQLNFHSGQCSSFLDHHLCSLATVMHKQQANNNLAQPQNNGRKQQVVNSGSMTKTKSYANIVTRTCHDSAQRNHQLPAGNELRPSLDTENQMSGPKIPLSKSINLGQNKFGSGMIMAAGSKESDQDRNQYDEPIIN